MNRRAARHRAARKDATPGARNLYIASTPLIALEASAAALALGGRSRLVLIEDFDLASRLANLLRDWPDCPFDSIELLPGRYTEHQRGAGGDRRRVLDFVHRIRTKRELRDETLATLRRIDTELQPDTVWVGNDRKVECQYALHLASTRIGARAGRYLDDGLHTYLGRSRQRPLVRWIDSLVKRVGYGHWGERVRQLGTTSWIAEAWLAFPELAVDADPARVRNRLPLGWFNNRAFRRLALLAAADFDVDRAALAGCSIVLVLPHSRLIAADVDLRDRLANFIRFAGERNQRVALKQHPREMHADPLGLAGDNSALLLPSALPMELLLPLLASGAALVGEASTALLAARWLRPDLSVFDFGQSSGDYMERARAFLALHGVVDLHGELINLLSR
ncbi:MAG: hypothetical protein ABIQ97_04465, partial [Lysobacteraceae bacterium]